MSQPTTPIESASFDIAAIDRELRLVEAYDREGHTARTLTRESDLRIVLISMKAGARIAEHRAKDTASVYVVTGHVRLHLPSKIVDLPTGRLLVMERDLVHDVEALEPSAFLLTLGWER